MESNSFGDVINVVWEFLVAGSSLVTTGAFNSDGPALVLLGIACIIATRRYLPTLADARTLQPSGAIEIQRAMRPSPAPLGAKKHVLAANNAPAPITPINGGSSRAA